MPKLKASFSFTKTKKSYLCPLLHHPTFLTQYETLNLPFTLCYLPFLHSKCFSHPSIHSFIYSFLCSFHKHLWTPAIIWKLCGVGDSLTNNCNWVWQVSSQRQAQSTGGTPERLTKPAEGDWEKTWEKVTSELLRIFRHWARTCLSNSIPDNGLLRPARQFGGQWRTIKRRMRGQMRFATWTDGYSCVRRMTVSEWALIRSGRWVRRQLLESGPEVIVASEEEFYRRLERRNYIHI